ncbi:class I adenylate-forming enzyme family protein [Kitasatospora saccharophila]|uniref:class I adenylate-forming enzyme family protein n=1 Tax=Kitasatospora saccharophila TaxID=407973 RepID=UPI00362772CA
MAPEWVDEVLLRGPGAEPCLFFDEPVTRDGLRRLVRERQAALGAAGLRRGGSVAVRLAPSLELVVQLLAGWRTGARVALLDHRLTPFETDRALERLAPQVLVDAEHPVPGGPARGHYRQLARVTPRPGRPAEGPHALVQLSSGSTGPAKVIGRTAADLVAELGRYERIDGVPRAGERMVSLASPVHVLGLVGGLLHCLHAGVRLAFPERITAEGVLAAVAAGPEPTTLLGVPFHLELLGWAADPPRLPQLDRHDHRRRAGPRRGPPGLRRPVRRPAGQHVRDDRGRRDRHRPVRGAPPRTDPAPGLGLREADGELLVAAERSPYLDPAGAERWADGWLRTRDGGSVDPGTGRVRVRGRLDSQVSVGGLKVDLTEVEHTVAALPEVESAVVLHGSAIEAYLVLAPGGTAAAVEERLAERLAAYKRPRLLHVLERLPRTATGKPVRDRAALAAAVRRP